MDFQHKFSKANVMQLQSCSLYLILPLHDEQMHMILLIRKI